MPRSADGVQSPWSPLYTITPAMASDLMAIEAIRTRIAGLRLHPVVELELRQQARLRSTHFSTRIEGNRLTLKEAGQVVTKPRVSFAGRERDATEVRCYWNALLRVEQWAARKADLSIERVQRLHALVEHGPRARPTPFRDGQNAIRDAGDGALVYLPPMAADVPALMETLVAWTVRAGADGLPVPIVAGLVHYQFVTIHPFYDGNGRTARLLATFLLQRGGYGLNGLLSVEEHHARDLGAYYRALAVHPHHNYYEGRAEADLSAWLSYFLGTLATVFQEVERTTQDLAPNNGATTPEAERAPDPRARRVQGLLSRQPRVTSNEVAALLGLSPRMARVLLTKWVAEGWLALADPSRKARAYCLSAR
jgi:Fic family protein